MMKKKTTILTNKNIEMEEYSDLKFDGDLSFLNENLDAAKFAEKEANAKQEIRKEEAVQFDRKEPVSTESVKFSDASADKMYQQYEQKQPINEPKAQMNQEPTQNTVEHMENRNESMNSETSNSNSTRDNNNNSSGMVNQNFQQTGEKKSQLEEMILNSGYGAEMFNNLKMELLEMEKEKIIMKYKQDLMMMIIKS